MSRFQRVEDLQEADKLWEAGLLWHKLFDDSPVVHDPYNECYYPPSQAADTFEWYLLLED